MGCLCHDLKEKFQLITGESSPGRFGEPTLKGNDANKLYKKYSRFADDLKIKRPGCVNKY